MNDDVIVHEVGRKDFVLPEIRIIPRAEWGALPAKGGIDPMDGPAEYVGYSCNQEETLVYCRSQKECSDVVQRLQKNHMEKGLPDIAYNFLIGHDGNVYEGRGWNLRPEIHYIKKGKYGALLDVCYIGISETKYLQYAMYETFLSFLNVGKEGNFIKTDCKRKNICDLTEDGEYEEEFYEALHKELEGTENAA